MGTKERVTEFLKECMADAVIKLMQDKPIEKITANDIANMAGVGRATWFRNYASKQEAITFKLVKMWERWAESHGLSEPNRFTAKNAKDFFEFNYNIRNLLNSIYATGVQSALYDAFYEILRPQCGADAEECYTSRFYSYGLFGLLDEWIKRDYHETPQEMADLFLRKITNE